MRIVNRAAFLALPAGTLFSKFAPDYFEGLQIKGETWLYPQPPPDDVSGDFLACSLADAVYAEHSEPGDGFGDACDAMADRGESVPVRFDGGRDGCFDAGQQFAVWEAADLRLLAEEIAECLRVAIAREIEAEVKP